PVLRDRERAPRTRNAIGEIAYQGGWKVPFAGA
ncbi:nitroreductase family protein, partial [Burkholderia gladioli]